MAILPVAILVFGAMAIDITSCTSSSSSSASPTPGPGFSIESIIVAAPIPSVLPPTATQTPSSSASPKRTRTATPTVTPTETARPASSPTSVESGATVGFDAQALFVRGKKQGYGDVTDSVLWSSTAPTVLYPPEPSQPGVYQGGNPGCACVDASAANVVSNFVAVGVNTDPDTCTCPLPGAVAKPNSTAIRNAGILMWTYDAGGALRGKIAAGPDGSVYFVTRAGFLHGLDSAGKSIMGAPAAGPDATVMNDGTVVAFERPSILAAFAPGGKVKWRLDIGHAAGPIAVASGAIYTLAGDEIVSVSPAGLLNWKIPADGAGVMAPSPDGVISAAAGGAVTAVASDGAVAWSFAPAGGFAGNLAVSGDTVYCGSGNGTLYAIDLRTGQQLWTLGLGGKIAAGPAVSPSGAIFIGADALRAISPDGRLEWGRMEAKPNGGPMVAVGGDFVFEAEADSSKAGSVGAMVGGDGAFIWTSRSFGKIVDTAASGAGAIYVVNSHGKIFAVR